jgi:hypothetical protein
MERQMRKAKKEAIKYLNSDMYEGKWSPKKN